VTTFFSVHKFPELATPKFAIKKIEVTIAATIKLLLNQLLAIFMVNSLKKIYIKLPL
jgi:hypothetical protein